MLIAVFLFIGTILIAANFCLI